MKGRCCLKQPAQGWVIVRKAVGAEIWRSAPTSDDQRSKDQRSNVRHSAPGSIASALRQTDGSGLRGGAQPQTLTVRGRRPSQAPCGGVPEPVPSFGAGGV